MFNYDALKNPLKAQCYDTWIFSHILTDDFYKQLKANYPEQTFVQKISQPDNPNSSSIRFDCFDYIEAGNMKNFNNLKLHPLWLSFYQAATSKKYLEIISNLTQLDLANIKLHLWFTRYHTGGYLSAHYDRLPNKILAQTFYFNDDWTASEGGYFDLLSNSEPRNKIFSVIPDRIYSTLVKCNPNAWHEVKPVTGKRTRFAVNLEYMIKSSNDTSNN